MNTDEFNSIFNVVYSVQQKNPPPDLSFERNITIRMLDSLGHCEFDYERRKVYVCPPLLVALPTYGLPKAVLTGARSPDLVSALNQAAKDKRASTRLTCLHQKGYPVMPDAITLESKDSETISEIAETLKITYNPRPAAWQLINYASGLAEIVGSYDFEERAELNWQRRVFSTKSLQFQKQTEKQGETRLVEYINPVNQQMVHWLWKGTLAAEVDRDWGRYMSLANNDVNVLIYDMSHNRISVPEFVPLPRLFARSLALCSGLAPARATIGPQNKLGFPSHLRVNIFSEVPPKIADLLCSKLSQKPIVHKMALDKNGEII